MVRYAPTLTLVSGEGVGMRYEGYIRAEGLVVAERSDRRLDEVDIVHRVTSPYVVLFTGDVCNDIMI